MVSYSSTDIRVLGHQEKFMTLPRCHYIILGNFRLGGDSLAYTSADVFGNFYRHFCAIWNKSITQWELFVVQMISCIAFCLLTRGKPYWLTTKLLVKVSPFWQLNFQRPGLRLQLPLTSTPTEICRLVPNERL